VPARPRSELEAAAHFTADLRAASSEALRDEPDQDVARAGRASRSALASVLERPCCLSGRCSAGPQRSPTSRPTSSRAAIAHEAGSVEQEIKLRRLGPGRELAANSQWRQFRSARYAQRGRAGSPGEHERDRSTPSAAQKPGNPHEVGLRKWLFRQLGTPLGWICVIVSSPCVNLGRHSPRLVMRTHGVGGWASICRLLPRLAAVPHVWRDGPTVDDASPPREPRNPRAHQRLLAREVGAGFRRHRAAKISGSANTVAMRDDDH